MPLHKVVGVIFVNNWTGIAKSKDENINIPRLIVITAVMVLGAAAGSIYTVYFSGDGFFMLSELDGTQLFRQLAVVGFIPVFASFLSSYVAYGAFVGLCAAFCRGFAFSAPLTAGVISNGISGYFSFAAAGSVCGILSVVSVIIMSMQAVETSQKRRNGRFEEEDGKNLFLLLLCCAAAIIFGAAIDAYLLK